MGILTLPKKQIWTSQPQGAVGINRSNEFGRKVDVYHLPPSSSLPPDKVGMAGLFKKQTSFFNIGKSNAVLARPFTVVIVACSAQANDSYYANLSIGSGNGFRLDAYTSGGGAYAAWTAQGVANGQTYVDGDGLFDTRKTVIVSDWTASGQTSWRKRDGQETVTWSDTFSYLTPGDNSVLIGGNFYAVAILFGNVGELGARRLIDNPWQIFKRQDSHIFVPVSAGGGPANITGDISVTLESITSNLQVILNHTGTLSTSLQDIVVTSSGNLSHSTTLNISLDTIGVSIAGSVTAANVVNGTLGITLDDIAISFGGAITHTGNTSFSLDDVFVTFSGTVAGTPENITGDFALTLDGIIFTSSGNAGTITLTEDDINAIMNAIINNPKTLTVPKFLGLK